MLLLPFLETKKNTIGSFRCKAAVAWAANEPMKVEEIEVAPPKEGEVRVKVVSNALVSGNEALPSRFLLPVNDPVTLFSSEERCQDGDEWALSSSLFFLFMFNG